MSARVQTSNLERNRIRVAVVTVAMLFLVIVLLAFQHLEQQRKQKPGVYDYLLDQNLQQPRDPFGIADEPSQDASDDDTSTSSASVSGLDKTAVIAGTSESMSLTVTCTGVSDDNRIVGYSIAAPLEQAVCEFDRRAQSLGWLIQGDNRQGVSTYEICVDKHRDPASSQFALVVYCERKNITSIVVELM